MEVLERGEGKIRGKRRRDEASGQVAKLARLLRDESDKPCCHTIATPASFVLLRAKYLYLQHSLNTDDIRQYQKMPPSKSQTEIVSSKTSKSYSEALEIHSFARLVLAQGIQGLA